MHKQTKVQTKKQMNELQVIIKQINKRLFKIKIQTNKCTYKQKNKD